MPISSLTSLKKPFSSSNNHASPITDTQNLPSRFASSSSSTSTTSNKTSPQKHSFTQIQAHLPVRLSCHKKPKKRARESPLMMTGSSSRQNWLKGSSPSKKPKKIASLQFSSAGSPSPIKSAFSCDQPQCKLDRDKLYRQKIATVQLERQWHQAKKNEKELRQQLTETQRQLENTQTQLDAIQSDYLSFEEAMATFNTIKHELVGTPPASVSLSAATPTTLTTSGPVKVIEKGILLVQALHNQILKLSRYEHLASECTSHVVGHAQREITIQRNRIRLLEQDIEAQKIKVHEYNQARLPKKAARTEEKIKKDQLHLQSAKLSFAKLEKVINEFSHSQSQNIELTNSSARPSKTLLEQNFSPQQSAEQEQEQFMSSSSSQVSSFLPSTPNDDQVPPLSMTLS